MPPWPDTQKGCPAAFPEDAVAPALTMGSCEIVVRAPDPSTLGTPPFGQDGIATRSNAAAMTLALSGFSTKVSPSCSVSISWLL